MSIYFDTSFSKNYEKTIVILRDIQSMVQDRLSKIPKNPEDGEYDFLMGLWAKLEDLSISPY